jgi:hypothetical protein
MVDIVKYKIFPRKYSNTVNLRISLACNAINIKKKANAEK